MFLDQWDDFRFKWCNPTTNGVQNFFAFDYNTKYNGTSKEWTFIYKDFTETSFSFRLVCDRTSSALSKMCLSKTKITHSVNWFSTCSSTKNEWTKKKNLKNYLNQSQAIGKLCYFCF